MDDDQIARLARSLFDANRRREQFVPLTAQDQPGSLEAAYRVQDAVYNLYGSEGGLGRRAGHKIALTSKALQEMCGISQPVYGAIFDSRLLSSPARESLADYIHLGLEFEVAVRIGENVPHSKTDWTRDSIAPYVAALMPAFELIEDRNADYSTLDAMSVLVDRCWCAGAVLGEPVTDWQTKDLARCAVQLIWNGESVDDGVTGDSMGHPLNGLAWVANHLASRGQQLQAGETIMTGSALKTRFPQAGDNVCYRIDGLGEVTIDLTA